MRLVLTVIASTVLGLGLVACSNADNSSTADNSLTATTPASGKALDITERNANNRLKDTLSKNLKAAGINAKITGVQRTELNNLYWVSLEGMPSVYTTADGKYIIQGDVVRLDKNNIHNISEELQASDTKNLLAGIKLKDTIIYKPSGNSRAVVYVFTDASCPYCHKLHEEMSAINAKGIEVRYLAWPRGEQFMPLMTSIWCSEDRNAAFDTAIKGLPVNAPQCKNPVAEQFRLGQQIGVNGTPAIYGVDGKYLGGYMSANELAKRLGL
ncbi:DsbC family protein [Alkanindiges sp. WGS2144]|uniref:DsbC family protein n=1 Tax=Alkanindiges sp. WGS2144 TaxID=3366808 RepID=UPI0037513D27